MPPSLPGWLYALGLLLISSLRFAPAGEPLARVVYADPCLLVITEARAGLHYSCDGGRHWHSGNGLPDAFLQDIGKGEAGWLLASSKGLLAADDPGGPWRPVGKEVVTLIQPLPSAPAPAWLIHVLGSGPSRLSAGTQGPLSARAVTGLPQRVLPTALVRFEDGAALGTWDAGVYRIGPRGHASPLGSGLGKPQITALAVTDTGSLLAGSYTGDVHHLESGRHGWRRSGGPMVDAPVTGFACRGDLAVAATYGTGVWVSRDDGHNWARAGAIPEARVTSVAFGSGDSLWAGTAAGLFRSDDAGANWREALFDRPDETFRLLATKGGGLYALVHLRGLLYSKDGCTGWRAVPTPGAPYRLARDVADRLLIGVAGQGVLVSEDGGQNWRTLVTGLPTADILALRETRDRRVFAVPEAGGDQHSHLMRLFVLGPDERWREVQTTSDDPFVTDYQSVWDLVVSPSGHGVAYGLQQLLIDPGTDHPWEIVHFGQMSWDPPAFDPEGDMWSLRQISAFVRRKGSDKWRQAPPPADLFYDFVPDPDSERIAARRLGGGIGLFEPRSGGSLLPSHTTQAGVKTNDLAWSKGRLFAATADGLRVSADSGRHWKECWYDVR